MAEHYIPDDLPTRIRHYIDGEFVDSVSGRTFDVLDPVSNETYATAAAGQKEDIDLAVAAARKAFTDRPVAADEAARTRPRPEPDRRRRRGPARPGWRSWRRSTPACRSPRPRARPSARRRTSASSRT